MNQVNLVGRLTRDPQVNQTNAGIKYLRNSLAIERTYTSRGGQKITDFINFSIWRESAEYLSLYAKKGTLVSLSGSLQSSNYTDKDGKIVSAIEVLANNVSILESRTTIQNRSSQVYENKLNQSNSVKNDYQETHFLADNQENWDLD